MPDGTVFKKTAIFAAFFEIYIQRGIVMAVENGYVGGQGEPSVKYFELELFDTEEALIQRINDSASQRHRI